MKIATWNLERPRQPKTLSSKNALVLERLKKEDPDILILTETNSCIDLVPGYVGSPSKELSPSEVCAYTKGENRTTIWSKSKYPKTRDIQTWDSSTSVCVCLHTECGELLVYGTVIGVLGHPNKDLDKQIADWKKIGESKDICIAGDFNIPFNDNDNFTKGSGWKVTDCFANLGISILTHGIKDNIDHVAVSNSFLNGASFENEVWNLEKELNVPRLSDHIGVSVKLEFHMPDKDAAKKTSED